MVNSFNRITLIVTFFLIANIIFPQSQTISNPIVSQPVKIVISQPMRDLPLIFPQKYIQKIESSSGGHHDKFL